MVSNVEVWAGSSEGLQGERRARGTVTKTVESQTTLNGEE